MSLNQINQLENNEFPKPNIFTHNLFETLKSTDTNFKWLDVLKYWEKNISAWVKNILISNPKNLIQHVQKYQLKKFLWDEKNVILKLTDWNLFANSKEVKSQILISLFTTLVVKK